MMLDFRSDTVTRPTSAMKEAMLSAPLGDDVFGDDPTVNQLQEKAAALFGMEAALFCPSGTMTNQIAIKVHTRPGEEVICDQLSHVYNYEGGGIAFNSGCQVRLMHGDRGRFTADEVKVAIAPDDPHQARTRLVTVENTSNKGGGAIWDGQAMRAIGQVCRERGLKYHLDGARLFNALVETHEHPKEYGALFDSISICLSKGLGCPVGSLLLGSADFIHEARRVRKVFGGGMRQAGMLAAAGIFALDHHVDRLREDHDRARTLADALAQLPWVESVLPVDSNIVIARLNGHSNDQVLHAMREKGIFAVGFGPGQIRFVTHLDISARSLDTAISILKTLKLDQ